MTLEEAIKALKEGKKIKRKKWDVIKYVQLDKDGKLRDDRGCETTFILRSNSIVGDNWEIVEEPILDKQEKKYLENFLRPYTKRYDKIKITKNNIGSGRFFIGINFFAFKNGEPADYINLPYFDKCEHMYEGMDEGKHYTPEELGLFKK